MKKLFIIFLPYLCFAQTFKGFQVTGGATFTVKPNQLFESFPNSFGDNVYLNNSVPANGLVAWFEPNTNITLNGSGVSSWCDLTRTYCLTQSTAANQPTYTTNSGRPYLAFNASTTYLSINNFGGVGANSAYTIIEIFKHNSTATSQQISYFSSSAVSGNGTYSHQLYVPGSAWQQYWQWGSGASYVLPDVTPISTSQTIIGTEINRGRGFEYVNLNSTYHSVTSTALSTTLTDYTNGTLYIGNQSPAFGIYLNGNIYELLYYNRALTSAEWTIIYNFFKAKYNL